MRLRNTGKSAILPSHVSAPHPPDTIVTDEHLAARLQHVGHHTPEGEGGQAVTKSGLPDNTHSMAAWPVAERAKVVVFLVWGGRVSGGKKLGFFPKDGFLKHLIAKTGIHVRVKIP